jgi:hypothetical protein
MSSIAHAVAIALFIGGAVSWVIGLRYFLAISAELHRARRAGEASFIPKASRGLPLMVLFSDALPNVSVQRRKWVWSFIAFVGFWLALLIVIMVFGPHHH